MSDATNQTPGQHISQFPDYLTVAAADLGRGTPVKVRILGDMASIARDIADAMLREILDARDAGRGVTLIVPVARAALASVPKLKITTLPLMKALP